MTPALPGRAVIYVDHGRPHPDKQETIALAHAEAHRMTVIGICSRSPDCAALVRSGAADVVVAAVADAALADLVRQAGGRVEVARPDGRPVGPVRPEIAGPIRRMAHRGDDTREIAEILDIPSGEVRRVKRLLGIVSRPRRGRGRGAR